MLVLLRFYCVDDGRLCCSCASVSDACSISVHNRLRMKKKWIELKSGFVRASCYKEKLSETMYSRTRNRKDRQSKKKVSARPFTIRHCAKLSFVMILCSMF